MKDCFQIAVCGLSYAKIHKRWDTIKMWIIFFCNFAYC